MSSSSLREGETGTGSDGGEVDGMAVTSRSWPSSGRGRVLHFECGNMFDVKNISQADVVMLETDIPSDLLQDLHRLLGGMKDGARTLTYLDLRKTWAAGSATGWSFPFRQLETNKNLSDRFPTSWSVQRGHHFYLWSKVQ